MQTNFNVPINHYLEVDFETFEGVVNAIGTVPVYVPGVRATCSPVWATPYGAGCYHLDGAAALQWVRARNLEILDPKGKYDPPTGQRWSLLDATADIGRIKRQQDFIKKLGRIAVQRTIDDPFIAPDIVDALMPEPPRRHRLRPHCAQRARPRLHGPHVGRRPGLQFETLPWYDPGKPVGGQSVVLVKQPEADAVLAQFRGEAPPPAPHHAGHLAPARRRVRPVTCG